MVENHSYKYAELLWYVRDEETKANMVKSRVVVPSKTTLEVTRLYRENIDYEFKAKPREGDLKMTVNEMPSLCIIPSRGLKMTIKIRHQTEDKERRNVFKRGRSTSCARESWGKNPKAIAKKGENPKDWL